MELVDTHCHIQSIGAKTGERHTRELWAKAELNADQVISSAAEAGVKHLICVGCDLNDSRLAVDFVQSKPNCYATIGIHPHEAKHFAGKNNRLTSFSALVTEPRVVAVGECGLDYYYLHSPKEDQLKLLRFQIELALKHELPLIFHVREAFADFWPVLDSYKGVRGVVHSFTDSLDNMQRAIERGLYVGVNGIATFAKDEAQLAVYKAIPLNKLLLETDAPFLTPTPYRGSINEPKRLRVVAEFLAGLHGIEQATLASATTSNAAQLFGLELKQ